jgi:predicted Rossmann-fold nucleotide-binding protein
MKHTWIKVHVVANHYTITFGNIFGTQARIVGHGGKDSAMKLANDNAKQNGFATYYLRVGGGQWREQVVA